MKNIVEVFGKKPRIGKKVFIDPMARIMGEVIIGDESAILFGSILRGDEARIELGNRVAVLENCLIEAPENSPVKIGSGSLISHGAIIHGAVIGSNVLIGIGAIVLDNAIINDNSIVAAGSVVPPKKEYPANSLIMGIPAHKARELTKDELHTIISEREKVLFKSKEYAKKLSLDNY